MNDDERITFWGWSGGPAFYVAILGCYLLIGLILLIAGALAHHRAAPVITGIVICGMSFPLLAAAARPVVVDGHAVRVPVLFRSTVVPLAGISGIGLIYRLKSRGAGWGLVLWDPDGKSVEIPRFILSTWSSPRVAVGVKRAPDGKKDWTIPLPNENTDRLATSKAGRVATRLYESVTARQGHQGPLVLQAKQKAVEYDPNVRSSPQAWWSPDGAMGRAKGLPPAEPTKLADPTTYKS
jgi:hypothetical protein